MWNANGFGGLSSRSRGLQRDNEEMDKTTKNDAEGLKLVS